MNENKDRMNMPIRIYMFIVLSVGLVATIFAQTLVEAPLDSAFIRYMQQEKEGKLQMMTDHGHGLGYIPSPVRFNTQLPSNILRETVTYPSSYDLRTQGKVTSVKDQGQCGSCWTFATMGSIESRWLVNGYGTYNLSENNLKECHGFIPDGCSGGNEYMATAYLSRGSGPIPESADPYVDYPVFHCTPELTPVAYESDAYFLPKDANTIKDFILNYGAVCTSMYMDNAYYNASNYSYYYNGTTSTDHAVLIVGWDDTKTTAGGTGAWIIKNSWGTSWGESGYFYVSYNDTRILSSNAFWPNRIDQNSDAVIYGYNDLGCESALGWGTSYSYGLVKFVASGLQTITKIATWIFESNSTVDFYVYDDFNGTTLSNQLGSLTGQSCTYAGYYTFNLPTPIDIASGNDFYVEVRYSTTNPQPVYPVPFEEAVPGFSNPTIETEECWTSPSGLSSSWLKLGANTSYPWDLCIRAYAISNPLPIQLASSLANVVKDNDVEVAWKTVSETNNYGFEIYRKRGETGEWTKIGFVQGHGTTLAPQTYTYADAGLSFGKYYYRIKQVDLDGKSETFPDMAVAVGVGPDKFILAQNYPNPFNPNTVIEFVVPQSGYASVKVYNLLGQEVATVFEGNAEAQKINTARFDASNLPSGMYFYTLKSAGKFETKRMMLMK